MAKKTFQVSFPDHDTVTMKLVEKIQEAVYKKTGNKPSKSEVFRIAVFRWTLELAKKGG